MSAEFSTMIGDRVFYRGLVRDVLLGEVKLVVTSFKFGWIIAWLLLLYVEAPMSVERASSEPEANKTEPWPSWLPIILESLFYIFI